MKRNEILLLFFFFLGTFPLTSQILWEEGNTLPAAPRERAFSFAIGDSIYLGGGRVNTTNSNTSEVWAYDTKTGGWERKSHFMGPLRRNSVAFSDGQFGYMGLGFDGDQTLTDFWKFDPAIDKWTPVSSFPGGDRSFANGLSDESNGYVIFGGDPDLDTYEKSIWKYDIAQDSWSKLTDFPAESRYRAVVFLFNNKIYTGLGNKQLQSAYSDFWEFDLATEVWTRKADFPSPLASGCFHFLIDGQFYVGEGVKGDGTSPPGNQVFRYDPQEDSWHKEADFIGQGRSHPISQAVNGRGFIGLGRNYFNGNHFRDLFVMTPYKAYPAFGLNIQEGCVPLEVDFTDLGTEATSWQWTFPGGLPAASTMQNPSVLYQEPGVYDVSLLVTTTEGYAYVSQESIIVTADVPEADFSFQQTEMRVDFTNTSNDATNYTWDFGDGNSSTEESPSHSYSTSGDYTVSLTAGNTCGDKLVTKTLSIISTAIQNTHAGFSLQVSPNPFFDTFQLNYSLPENFSNARVSIYNSLGQVVLQQELELMQGSIQWTKDWPMGIYFLQLESEGRKSLPLKIITNKYF